MIFQQYSAEFLIKQLIFFNISEFSPFKMVNCASLLGMPLQVHKVKVAAAAG